jgi:hypothetical protein
MRIAKPGLGWNVIVELDRPYRTWNGGGRPARSHLDPDGLEVVEGPAAAASEITVRFGTEPAHPADPHLA